MSDATAFSLTGRTAIVTGAAGLLGRHHVGALAEAGATVIAVDRDARMIDDFVHSLDLADEAIIPAAADVTTRESLVAVRDLALAVTGRIDILVSSAAIDDKVEGATAGGEAAGLEHYPVDAWRRMIDVNVTGVFLAAQVFGSHMAQAGSGSIVNIASTYGLVAPDPAMYVRPDGSRPFVKSPAYPASKGAVIGLTRYLAAYWGEAGVRVNSLAPGGVENGQEEFFVRNYARRTPLGRMAAPGDYRGAIVFLASDASRYMTGATLVVDGGFTAW